MGVFILCPRASELLHLRAGIEKVESIVASRRRSEMRNLYSSCKER